MKLLVIVITMLAPFLPQAQESTDNFYIFDMTEFLSEMEKPWSIGNGIDTFTGEFVGPYFEVVVQNGMNMNGHNLEIMNTTITVYGDSINSGQVTKRFETSNLYFAPLLSEPEVDYTLDIKMYPNPASSIVNFSGEYVTRFAIYNMSGNVVRRGKPNSDSFSVMTQSLSSGVYIVQLWSLNFKGVFKKLVIK